MAALRTTHNGLAPARAGKAKGAGMEESKRALGFELGGLSPVERRALELGLCYRRDCAERKAER